MKKNLKIFSTSSLAFESNKWESLKKDYKLFNEEFINLERIQNIRLNSELNYFVVFIDDVFQISKKNNHYIINLIIKNINQLAKNSDNKIIFSFIFRDETNSINFSKFENQKNIWNLRLEMRIFYILILIIFLERRGIIKFLIKETGILSD